jgi:hypothetical protein
MILTDKDVSNSGSKKGQQTLIMTIMIVVRMTMAAHAWTASNLPVRSSTVQCSPGHTPHIFTECARFKTERSMQENLQ